MFCMYIANIRSVEQFFRSHISVFDEPLLYRFLPLTPTFSHVPGHCNILTRLFLCCLRKINSRNVLVSWFFLWCCFWVEVWKNTSTHILYQNVLYDSISMIKESRQTFLPIFSFPNNWFSVYYEQFIREKDIAPVVCCFTLSFDIVLGQNQSIN